MKRELNQELLDDLYNNVVIFLIRNNYLCTNQVPQISGIMNANSDLKKGKIYVMDEIRYGIKIDKDGNEIPTIVMRTNRLTAQIMGIEWDLNENAWSYWTSGWSGHYENWDDNVME